MANKLDQFLIDKKIDHRRLLNASRQLERLRPEDRKIKLTQAQARKREDGKNPEGLDKPRSGRTVAKVGLANALAGKRVSGPQKNRILSAVNRILEQRKQKPAALGALFDLAPPAKPKTTEE